MTRTLLQLSCAVAVAGLACSRTDSTREPSTTSAPPAVEAGAEAPRADRIPGDWPRIVFLGDSLTAGYGLSIDEAVPALVQDRLVAAGYAYAVAAHGVSGDTSAGGLSRLDYALEGDVAVLVVELGGNDGLRGLPVEGLERNLETIISTARSRGIDVLLTGMEAPPNFGEAYTASFRQVYHDLADMHDVVFVPFYLEGVAGIPELNLADGIHPNAAGSRIILETIWAALEPMLERREVGQERVAR